MTEGMLLEVVQSGRVPLFAVDLEFLGVIVLPTFTVTTGLEAD